MTTLPLSLRPLLVAAAMLCVLSPALAMAESPPPEPLDASDQPPFPPQAEALSSELSNAADAPDVSPDSGTSTAQHSAPHDAEEDEELTPQATTETMDVGIEEDELTRNARRYMRNREALEARPDRSGISDAVYQRPFVVGGQRAALGGYMEAGGTWTKNEGIVEGVNFSLARFNLFVYARVLPRVEFMSELEFENGGQEIKIETAQLDFALVPWLSLRAGVLLVPIGGFNQDHDAPRWPLVDRPLVSETILPATLSEVGFGFHGEKEFGEFRLNGQLYVTNGLSDGIIGNTTGRVDIPSGKAPGILDVNTNGRPTLSGRLAGIYGESFELGVSAYHGAYNQWKMDGERVDDRRTLTLGALDLRAEVWRFELRGEAAMAWIDVPDHSRAIYATRQFGWHLDLYTDLWRHPLGTGTNARLRWVMRAEQADYYVGNLPTGARSGDQITGLTVGLAWQLDDQLVIRTGVRNRWFRDLLNNPAEREVQVQIGVASYF